jgi:hypothetical protein
LTMGSRIKLILFRPTQWNAKSQNVFQSYPQRLAGHSPPLVTLHAYLQALDTPLYRNTLPREILVVDKDKELLDRYCNEAPFATLHVTSKKISWYPCVYSNGSGGRVSATGLTYLPHTIDLYETTLW